MMFKVRIGDLSALLNQQQLNELTSLLDGATHWSDRWRGAGKGFYGPEQELEIKLEAYKPSQHLRGVEMFSDQEIDALSTLIAMRKQHEESNHA